jgi:predicted ATPase
MYLKEIPPFLVVVGANGSGKSTLFEVFGFLHDCLKGNVRQALDKRGRFAEVLSRGCDPAKDTIGRITVPDGDHRQGAPGDLFAGNRRAQGAPVVLKELLRYKRGRYGSPYHFLSFSNGEGYAITNEEDFNKSDEELDRETQNVAPDTSPSRDLGNSNASGGQRISEN